MFNYNKLIVVILAGLLITMFAGCTEEGSYNLENTTKKNEISEKVNATKDFNTTNATKENNKSLHNSNKEKENATEEKPKESSNKSNNITTKLLNKEIKLDDSIVMKIISHGYYINNDSGIPREYYRVDIELINVNPEKKVRYNILDPFLIDEYGNRYEFLNNGGNISIAGELNIGESARGYYLFEKVPKTSKYLTLEFKYGFINPRYEYVKLYDN